MLPFSVGRRPRGAILRDISMLQRFASGRDYLPSPSNLLQPSMARSPRLGTCQASGPAVQWSRSPAGREDRRLSLAALQHPFQHFPIPCKSRSNPVTQRAHFNQHAARNTQAQAPPSATFSKAMAPPRWPMWHALKFSMGFPVWCRILSIWQHGRRAKFVCRVVRECISGAACRCALAAFVCPVTRRAPRIYSSAIVDTALGVLVTVRPCPGPRGEGCEPRWTTSTCDSSNPPRYPKPIACCAVRERIYPGTPSSLPRRLECKAVLKVCTLVIQTIMTICSLSFARVFPVCCLCVARAPRRLVHSD